MSLDWQHCTNFINFYATRLHKIWYLTYLAALNNFNINVDLNTLTLSSEGQNKLISRICRHERVFNPNVISEVEKAIKSEV